MFYRSESLRISRLGDLFLSLPVVLFLLLACGAKPLHAQTVTVSVGAVNKSVWVANAIHTVNSRRDFEKPVLVTFVNKLYEQNPGLRPADAVRLLNEAQQKYNEQVTKGLPADEYMRGKTEYDLTNSMFNILGSLPVPGAETAAAIARESLMWANRESAALLDAEGKVLARNELFNSYASAREYQKEQWEAAYDLARRNPNAAMSINRFFGPYLNAGTADTTNDIFNKNPDFANNQNIQAIKAMIGPDGAIQASLSDLKRLTVAQYGELKNLIVEDRALLRDIDQKQAALIAYVANERERAAAQARAERQRRIHQLKLDAAGSSVYLLSTFIGLSDPKLGRAVSVTGNAAIQIAESVSKYSETAANLDELGSALGSVVLTGNIVGAALNIFSLFNNTPTAEQMILDEVRELRNQVASLRGECTTGLTV